MDASFAKRLARTAAATVCAAALTALAALTLPALVEMDSHPEVHYAALGDSYSSGTGAGSYSQDGDTACRRSSRAYGPLWAKIHHPASFQHLACSGAVTSDVIAKQIPAMNEDTTMVTLTISGNDAGFMPLMTTCTLSDDDTCQDAINDVRAELPTRIAPAVADTLTAIHKRAPKAHVIVLGYPRLFDPTTTCPGAIDQAKRQMIDTIEHDVDQMLSTVTDNAGTDFTFADPTQAFIGHETCTTADPWINPVTLPPVDSFHPTAAGHQKGYLPVLERVVG